MVKILVTGNAGQLGFDIVNELSKRNIEAVGIDKTDLDITDEKAVDNFFVNNAFSHVIHCAAWTAVDKAEEKENEKLVYDVNVNGTKYIMKNCLKYDMPMMYFSTDYVFGGEGDKPFKVDDKVNPLGKYALTKYLGEEEVRKLKKYFIIRISWAFGKNGSNFIKTMLNLSKNHKELNVVSDQVGSPTYMKDLAVLASDMILTNKYGTYHATNEGYVSWADFAREIFKLKNINIKVNDVTTEEYNAKAKRPKNSRLDKTKLDIEGFNRLPTWQDALDRFLKELDES